MLKKGSLSYQDDDVRAYLEIQGTNLTNRMERINNDVARVYLVDHLQVQQPIPPFITMTKNSTGAAMQPFLNNFMVTWSASYTLSVHNQPYMHLNQLPSSGCKWPRWLRHMTLVARKDRLDEKIVSSVGALS